MSVLGREVLPFLAGVMTADRISVADADRARELAEALRRALKAGIESTWLDDLAANVHASRGIPVVVDDPVGGAARPRRRPAIRPHRADLLAGRGEPSAAIRVTITTEPRRRRIVVEAEHGASPPARRDLDRFAAVARAVSMRAELSLTGENVHVELSHVPD